MNLIGDRRRSQYVGDAFDLEQAGEIALRIAAREQVTQKQRPPADFVPAAKILAHESRHCACPPALRSKPDGRQ